MKTKKQQFLFGCLLKKECCGAKMGSDATVKKFGQERKKFEKVKF
jgi:hypothetical protein